MSHSLVSKRRCFPVTRLLISGRTGGGGEAAAGGGGGVTTAKEPNPGADIAKVSMEGAGPGPDQLLSCDPLTLQRPLTG